MDAVEFLKEGARMCDTYAACEGCYGRENACFVNDTDWRKNPEGVVAAVEEFAAENPKVTRQEAFLLAYPETTLDKNGVLCIMPCQIDKRIHDDRMNGSCKLNCNLCRRKYWFADCKTKNKFSL